MAPTRPSPCRYPRGRSPTELGVGRSDVRYPTLPGSVRQHRASDDVIALIDLRGKGYFVFNGGPRRVVLSEATTLSRLRPKAAAPRPRLPRNHKDPSRARQACGPLQWRTRQPPDGQRLHTGDQRYPRLSCAALKLGGPSATKAPRRPSTKTSPACRTRRCRRTSAVAAVRDR
jgi:hypothetical protein